MKAATKCSFVVIVMCLIALVGTSYAYAVDSRSISIVKHFQPKLANKKKKAVKVTIKVVYEYNDYDADRLVVGRGNHYIEKVKNAFLNLGWRDFGLYESIDIDAGTIYLSQEIKGRDRVVEYYDIDFCDSRVSRKKVRKKNDILRFVKAAERCIRQENVFYE